MWDLLRYLFGLFEGDIFAMLPGYILANLLGGVFGYLDRNIMAIGLWHVNAMLFGNLFRNFMANFLWHLIAMLLRNFMWSLFRNLITVMDRFFMAFIFFMISMTVMFTVFLVMRFAFFLVGLVISH